MNFKYSDKCEMHVDLANKHAYFHCFGCDAWISLDATKTFWELNEEWDQLRMQHKYCVDEGDDG